MNAQQLRNSILQEAIEGRLVPQDPNDEPASVLLNRIREEKKQLVKDGKLKKKDLEETPISEDEIPFEIPDSWEWVRIGDYANKVTDFVASGSFATLRENVKYYSNKEYAILVRTKDFQTNFQTDLVYTDKHGYDFLSNSNLHGGELILPNIGASIGKIFIVPKLDYPMTLAPNTVMIRFYWEEQRDWVYTLFRSALGKALLNEISSSTAQGKFNKTDFKKLVLPLPPLAEQKRIVAKIEELLPKVEEYGKAQDALNKLNEELPERLKKSILQEAIEGRLVPQDPNDEPASVLLNHIREEKKQLVKEGKLKKKDLEETPVSEDEKPFEIPESWEWVRIKDVFIINPKVIADDNADAAFIPMEKIEACYGSRFSFEIRKWKNIKSSFTCFADGDVAFAKITPCFQNRKSMILRNLPNGIGAGTTELKVLRQYSETIEREYLLYFLASSYFIDEATFKGTANQQRIIVGYLENKTFPLPPLAEQKRIVAKIEEVFKEIDKLKEV